MIEHGRKILTAEVGGWYDCGKLDTLLETNEILLRHGSAKRRDFPGVTINDPVLIQDGVTIEKSVIGPNVTLEAGTKVVNSQLAHVIVGKQCEVVDSTLHHSMLGDRVSIRGLKGYTTLGDDSEVNVG